jgi:2-keto-4-pentenoate hydratase/2-oxohepta-3-ene-1,7-dioic acid hydratase in catechol pathway
MRLATIQTPAGPRGAVLKDGHYVEIGCTVRQWLEGTPIKEGARHAASGAKLLAPIPDPPKVICIGLNYRDHAEESGAAIPRDPVVFCKFQTAIVGPEAPIVLPKVSQKVDYEAELVLVVGKGGKDIPRDKAMGHVAALTVGHDVSARDWQLEKDGKQWLLGKTFDTFAPIGPHLVTMDEAGDPHALGVRLRLNGTTMQDSSTAQLIFRVEELIAYLSQVFTLQPGDLVFTGTPPGVGAARKPPVYLKGGDMVEVEIDGLGVLRNPVVAG